MVQTIIFESYLFMHIIFYSVLCCYFISYKIMFACSLLLYRCSITLSVNRTSYFQFVYIQFFLVSNCFGSNSSTVLNTNEIEGGHPFLVPDFTRENFSGFLYSPFSWDEYILSGLESVYKFLIHWIFLYLIISIGMKHFWAY